MEAPDTMIVRVCGTGKVVPSLEWPPGTEKSASSWPSLWRTRQSTPIRVARVSPEQAQVTLGHPKMEKYLGWPARLAVCAVARAHRAATWTPVAADRVGIFVATGQSGLEEREFFPALDAAWSRGAPGDYAALGGPALRRIDPYFSLRTLANAVVAFAAQECEARGPSQVFVQSAVAGVHAWQAACDALREGRCHRAIVVGGDSLLDATTILVRERAGWLDLPAAAALGEGAAAIIVERADVADGNGLVVDLSTRAGLALSQDEDEAVTALLTPWFAAPGEEPPRVVICATAWGAGPAVTRAIGQLGVAAPRIAIRDVDLGAAAVIVETAAEFEAWAAGAPACLIVAAEPGGGLGAVRVRRVSRAQP